MYNSLIGLAKESLQGGTEGGKAGKSVAEMVDKGAKTEKAVLVLVAKLRELLKELPPENLATMKFIVQHLRRIVEVEQENKMTSGNLGIIFGPTLMRPRPTEATISLSSLVDYPHQARIIEALIIFYSAIFETDQTFADGLEEAAKEEEEEEKEPIGNQENTSVQPHDGVPYHLPTPDQAEAALHEDSYGGEMEPCFLNHLLIVPIWQR
ncbi:rho GTPase-activating protein 45-like [Sceloporus undulatus]|uniref:rho GTPase-activating protein 45-like n=1 Tax=Sceloporus undulatus TaxID=8520 RepID=UPI001C4C4ED9|nr:rho GTPase-activating protein 45-like [Sceloporus undulatus]